LSLLLDEGGRVSFAVQAGKWAERTEPMTTGRDRTEPPRRSYSAAEWWRMANALRQLEAAASPERKSVLEKHRKRFEGIARLKTERERSARQVGPRVGPIAEGTRNI
jgi:hypothetical protein